MSDNEPKTSGTPRPKMTMPKGRLVTHVDREDLYTSLEARIKYLHSFLDFSQGVFAPFPQTCVSRGTQWPTSARNHPTEPLTNIAVTIQMTLKP